MVGWLARQPVRTTDRYGDNMSSSQPSFAGFTWEETKGCRACSHILAGLPVLLFVHEADGSLQFLCGAEGHAGDDAVWVHLNHVLDKHPDLCHMPTVDMGQESERPARGQDWTVSSIPNDY